ncbi:MAG TPA: caspase family protein, partial [Thermoanaerobaculia bacterium]|nr:caspase family protein [Thermoanaerobaculia bacterium]
MDKLYALLVGIDDYDFKPLHGCVNDVEAMRELLTGRFPKEQLELQVLLNEEATRQGIIKTFREHLGKAVNGDTALFFYAGHGSREAAPPEYRHLEPDGLDDTLIAYDSRLKDRQEWDLADKELRVLIAEVAARNPHVVVILDCCHSGSATRTVQTTRHAEPAAKEPRPADTFWFFKAGTGLPRELGGADHWRLLPSGRHVLLAACEDHQSAGECADPDDKPRGRFSYHLIEAMKEMSGDVRYRDLFKRVQTQVCNHSSTQVPQAYGELDAVLFDGSMPVRPPVFYLRKLKDKGWRLDAGKVHAVQEKTVLDIFHDGAVTGERSGPRLAKVEVTRVDATESAIRVKEGTLPEDAVALPAIISYLPFPPLKVALKGCSAKLKKGIDDSPYLQVEEGSETEVVVEEGPKEIKLKYKDSDREMVAPDPSAKRGVRWAVAALEKIARWKALLGIANSGDSLASQLRMTIYKWLDSPSTPSGEPRTETFPEQDEVHGEEIHLPYKGYEEPGRLTVCLENHSGQPLYYALFGLSEAFAIKMIEDASGRLPPEQKIWVRGEEGFPGTVADEYHERGVTQRRDTLLLLVSDQPQADLGRLEQTGVLDDSTLRGDVADLQDLLSWRRYRELGGEARKGRWAA